MLWEFYNQIPLTFKVRSPGDSQSLLPGPQVWKSVVGPRTFATAWELLWYSCSPVCGSPVQQLCSGANGDLLQEDLCHLPGLPALLLPVLLSPWEATADPCLCRRPSNTQRQVWLSLLWGSLLLSVGFGAHKILFMPPKSLWQIWSFKCDCTPPAILLLRLCPWMWSSFSWWFQHSLFDGCSAASCDFGVLTGEDEHTSFYSAKLNF